MSSRVKPIGSERCPQGYEYVDSYRGQDGRYVPAYCRKLKRYRGVFSDPMVREDRMKAKREQESLKRAMDIAFGDDE